MKGLAYYLILGICSLPLLFILLIIHEVFPVIYFVWPFATGWVSFLTQTVPRVEFDTASWVTFGLCLGGFACAIHFVGAMIYRHVWRLRGEEKPWRAKWSVALVAGMVLLFVSGMAGVGLFYSTSWLVAEKDWSWRANVLPLDDKKSPWNLTETAKHEGWSTEQLVRAAHERVREMDGRYVFLVATDPAGEWRGVIAYESANPARFQVASREPEKIKFRAGWTVEKVMAYYRDGGAQASATAR